MHLIPTIHCHNQTELVSRLDQLQNFATRAQIDVEDGTITNSKTFDLELVSHLDSPLIWEVHLMVKEPLNWLQKCLLIGASRIVGQVELMSDRQKFVDQVKSQGVDVGLGFNIETPISDIPLDTDIVLLLGRPAGFTPLPFDDSVLSKITQANNLGFPVAVDGGVNTQNYVKLTELGVDTIYSGQDYFQLLSCFPPKK